MPQALISAMNLTTWRYRRAGIANRCDVSAAHSGAEGNGRMAEQSGIRTVRCNRLACTGSRYTTFSKAAGLEVYLVNARETKNLPGRKSDVQESQWADEAAHVWAVAQFIPAAAGDSHDADVLAAAQ